jgi:hypothetical protein
VGRHADPYFHKLTRTEFVVLDLLTGNICKSMQFRTCPLSTHSMVLRRSAFTTAFEHEFLLTDKFIVSGGQGGELLVWDYTRPEKECLLYSIPVWCSGFSKGDEFLRTFSSLTLSVDGHYIGATTSDQLLIIDMVNKRVHGRYSNGRRVDTKEMFVRNPKDDFLGGVWCWWKEWGYLRDPRTGEIEWEEAVAASSVAYLTNIVTVDDRETRRGLCLRRLYEGVSGPPSLWDCAVWALVCGVYFAGELSLWFALLAVFSCRILVAVVGRCHRRFFRWVE